MPGSNIGHGFFLGWVIHPDVYCWVSYLYPAYLPAIFVLSAKLNKTAQDRTIPHYFTIPIRTKLPPCEPPDSQFVAAVNRRTLSPAPWVRN